MLDALQTNIFCALVTNEGRGINDEQETRYVEFEWWIFFEGIIFIKLSNHHRLQRGCYKFAFVTQPKQFYDLRFELVVGNFNWF